MRIQSQHFTHPRFDFCDSLIYLLPDQNIINSTLKKKEKKGKKRKKFFFFKFKSILKKFVVLFILSCRDNFLYL